MSATKATAQDAASKKEALNIRNRLKNPERRFVYSKFSRDSYDSEFKYVNQDAKLMAFASGDMGLVSDCYLLYAVCALGFADIEGVGLFLAALHSKHKDLSIPRATAPNLKSRLGILRDMGMLYRHYYDIPRNPDPDEMEESVEGDTERSRVVIYSAPSASSRLVENKLGRPLAVDPWVAAKPLFTIMGWASCAYVAGKMACNKTYIDQIQGVYQTPAVGKVMMPCMLKMLSPDGTDVEYVGVFPAFLHLDKMVTTEEMFEKNCEYMFRRMAQFFFYHDKKGHLARMVIVVEDNSDLVQMAMRMHAFGDFKEDYDRIYFTGEGPVRMAKTTKLAHCFLRMMEDNSEQGYSFIPASPDFLQ